MKTFTEAGDGKYELYLGVDLFNAVIGAIEISKKTEKQIIFEFNGAKIRVNHDSDPYLICRQYDDSYSRGRVIGPYPKDRRTQEERNSDALSEKSRIERNKREAEARQLKRARQKRQEAKFKALRTRVEAVLKNAPSISLKNKEGWEEFKKLKNNSLVVEFAERWARLMQIEIESGKSVKDVANDTSYEAEFEDISPQGRALALNALVQCWFYGEELKLWYEDMVGKTID